MYFLFALPYPTCLSHIMLVCFTGMAHIGYVNELFHCTTYARICQCKVSAEVIGWEVRRLGIYSTLSIPANLSLLWCIGVQKIQASPNNYHVQVSVTILFLVLSGLDWYWHLKFIILGLLYSHVPS